MSPPDHLALRLIRLTGAEEWTPMGKGLRFLFPQAGVGKYVSGPVAASVSKGEVLALNGTEAGKVRAMNGPELVLRSFSVRLEHLFPFLAANELPLLARVTENLNAIKWYPASTPVAMACHRLLNEIQPEFNLDHRIQLVRIAAAVLAEEFKVAETNPVGFVRAGAHITRVFRTLLPEDLVTLSVAALADKFGCSRRHLNRLFHQEFGSSVTALRLELRLLKAITLLRDPDAKVINIAGQCGFNHLGRFNSCFKRRFGTSPSRWRQRGAQPESNSTGRSEAISDCPFISLGLCRWLGNSARSSPVTTGSCATPNPFPAKLLITLKALKPNESEMPVRDRALHDLAGRNLSPEG
jgi:AraC-like DNA-binding protein